MFYYNIYINAFLILFLILNNIKIKIKIIQFFILNYNLYKLYDLSFPSVSKYSIEFKLNGLIDRFIVL